MLELISQPWPWYIAGPLIGLIVPLLLIAGNRSFGISSSLRHVCAACFPSDIAFFKYDWRKEIWNLYFVFGILIGAVVVSFYFPNPLDVEMHPDLRTELSAYAIDETVGLLPPQIFSWSNLLSGQGLMLMVFGGFLIGFGTRYAGGCTSGHAIMGLSTLQWPSLVATCCFMIGGILSAQFLLPWILSL